MELILGGLAFLFMASGFFLRSMVQIVLGLVLLLVTIALSTFLVQYVTDILYELYLI